MTHGVFLEGFEGAGAWLPGVASSETVSRHGLPDTGPPDFTSKGAEFIGMAATWDLGARQPFLLMGHLVHVRFGEDVQSMDLDIGGVHTPSIRGGGFVVRGGGGFEQKVWGGGGGVSKLSRKNEGDSRSFLVLLGFRVVPFHTCLGESSNPPAKTDYRKKLAPLF